MIDNTGINNVESKIVWLLLAPTWLNYLLLFCIFKYPCSFTLNTASIKKLNCSAINGILITCEAHCWWDPLLVERKEYIYWKIVVHCYANEFLCQKITVCCKPWINRCFVFVMDRPGPYFLFKAQKVNKNVSVCYTASFHYLTGAVFTQQNSHFPEDE